jgi:hypothetical protein
MKREIHYEQVLKALAIDMHFRVPVHQTSYILMTERFIRK